MRHLIRWAFRASVAVVLVIVAYLGVTAFQVNRAANTDQVAADGDSGSSVAADAIVVLGAAQYNGKPSQVLAKRLDHAIELYRGGVAPLIVVTGYKQEDDRFTEAYASLKYLLNNGVPDGDVMVVDDGSNTWESLSAVRRATADRQVDSMILVSSRYHNRRLRGIAGELGLNVAVSSVGHRPTRSQLAGETLRVGVGQIIGFRRLSGLTR